MKNKLLPADTYTVVNQTILTEADKKILISLYEPIIGPIAVSLYLTFWCDLDKLEICSTDFTHHHLMTILKTNLDIIQKNREALEAVGLIKSYVKYNENINEYLYELYSPISAYEFFNHPVLSVLLLNNIGEIEYNNLLNYYKKIVINKKDYEEITSTMNETFKSVTPFEKENELIRRKNKLNINIDNLIDFTTIEASIPKGLVNSKTFNKRTKDLINQLAFIYNVDSIKMADFVRLVIDNVGLIDKDKLRETVRRNYEFNNNGSLPTIVYRTQPDRLKAPVGDNSNRGKIIQVFENTKPYDFLMHKNKGVKPSSRDLKLLEHLAVDFDLPAGVINVLVDYAIRVNDGKLNQKYLEAIASTWNRKGIKLVSDAMDALTKNHKKTTVKVDNKTKTLSQTPAWMNASLEHVDLSDEELKELEEEMKDYR